MKYPAFQELETPRLRLRRLSMTDVDPYFRHLGSSPVVTQYMLWEPHQEISESRESIQKALKRYEGGRFYRWAIALREDNALIGMIDLLRFDEAANSCSFAYMLGQPFWNQGYGTEALQAVFHFAFTHMQLESITADHFAVNAASGAVMRKAGMRRTRILPGKYEKKGTTHDAIEYRITKEEWTQHTEKAYCGTKA